MNLFKKAAVFGDLHLGKRSDSPVHNQDCREYVEWFCEQAVDAGVDRIIFIGDWFDNRSRIRLDTQHVGNELLRMLLEVAPVDMLVGNHDMFFKNNRAIHSLDAYRDWANVTVYDECTVTGNVGFAPYLVGTEYLEVIDMDAKYIFGHFELPTFLLNESMEMPDRGGFNSDQFQKPSMVFSGHFHKRQLKTNTSGIPVWYIGNPFGHDFNDVEDAERGMMILEWDQEPHFIDWKDGPLYQRFTTTDVMDHIENDTFERLVRPSSILEIKDNMGLALEDISLLREELNPVVREARLLPTAQTPGLDMDAVVEDIDNKSLTQVVVEHLRGIDSHGTNINPDMLVELFKGK